VDPAVVAWLVQSCDRQGVPIKVTDAAVVARVAALLGLDPASASHPYSTSALGPRGKRDDRELRAS
jgi:hypothetical protein